MAKFVWLNSHDEERCNDVKLSRLGDERLFIVEGERHLGYEGEQVQYALRSCVGRRNKAIEKMSFNARRFDIEFTNLKLGNIGVSSRPPVMGKDFSFRSIEPGYGGTMNSRRYYFSEVNLLAAEIIDVKYLGDKIFQVKTIDDYYFVQVRDTEAALSKNHVYLAVCGDGFPLFYGDKTFQYVMWSSSGWYITKSNKVFIEHWNRISERVYKATRGNTTFYVLVWHG